MKWKIIIYWLSEGKGAREVYNKSKTPRNSNSSRLQLKPTFKSWNYAALADWAELIYRHLINCTGESPLLLLGDYNIYIDNYKTNLKRIRGGPGGYSTSPFSPTLHMAHSRWSKLTQGPAVAELETSVAGAPGWRRRGDVAMPGKCQFYKFPTSHPQPPTISKRQASQYLFNEFFFFNFSCVSPTLYTGNFQSYRWSHAFSFPFKNRLF